jgi:UDP-N-acetylglucosamine--N-acetylmuramyl-(pentapeptide) pyrophosphoryl-undecaprenol N-acetylglucosamine transferase
VDVQRLQSPNASILGGRLIMPKVLLATGGTGGHIFPAVAAARALESLGFSCAILGGSGGMEERVAAQEGLEFFGVRTGKLDRSSPDPRAVLRALAGFGDALKIVARVRPVAVVGFGGFASFPGSAAAVLRGVPLILHEANARPGLVTKLLAGFSRRVALADETASKELPSNKSVWVGMPVREVRVPRVEALVQLGLEPDKPLVLVMGGSQGSLKLNRLLPGILEPVLAGKNVQVLHQTGRGRLEEVAPRVAHLPWYHTTEFVDGPTAWSAASAGITRAGYSTIADAAFHGVPLVMVPLPSASEDHQTKNARSVEARGAGLVVTQNDLEHESELRTVPRPKSVSITASTTVNHLDPGSLPGPLETGILACLQPERAPLMRASALASSPEGAAKRLAALVLDCIGSSQRVVS